MSRTPVPFAPETLESIRRAFRLAADRRHDLVGLEHLLYALIEDPQARQLLSTCGVDFVLHRLAEAGVSEHIAHVATRIARLHRRPPRLERLKRVWVVQREIHAHGHARALAIQHMTPRARGLHLRQFLKHFVGRCGLVAHGRDEHRPTTVGHEGFEIGHRRA